jgi:3-oxoacyl-[acyl-carrier protein] reductase
MTSTSTANPSTAAKPWPHYSELRGKRALLTGGGRGIAAELAAGLVAQGAQVVIADVDGPQAEAKAKELTQATPGAVVHPVTMDVTNEQSINQGVEASVKALGGLDLLVNNAGGFTAMRKLAEIPTEEWDRILSLNLRSTFLVTKAAMPHLKSAGAGGAIVNFASLAGRTGQLTSAAHYAAAKAAIIQLTRTIASELASDQIRVNAIAPGTTLTERVVALRTPEQNAEIERRTPLGRLPTVRDIACVALFLLSDSANCVTGITIDANSGLYMG